MALDEKEFEQLITEIQNNEINAIYLSNITKEQQQILCHTIASNSSLKHFAYSSCSFTNEQLIMILNNQSITHLYLSNCNLGLDTIRLLSIQTSIEFLDVSYNKIDDFGAKILAQHKSIRSLNLSCNNIGPAGAKALAQNKTLEKLQLWGNHIDDIGAIALSKNKSLKILRLNYNNIGSSGLQALATNTSLISLDIANISNISDNTLNDWTKKLISQLIHCSLIDDNFLLKNHFSNKDIKQFIKTTLTTPGNRLSMTNILIINKALESRKARHLAIANIKLPKYLPYFSTLAPLPSDRKLLLLFKVLDIQIQCRNTIALFFINKIDRLLPVPELCHRILSFIYPNLSGLAISQSWKMAEERLYNKEKKSKCLIC